MNANRNEGMMSSELLNATSSENSDAFYILTSLQTLRNILTKEISKPEQRANQDELERQLNDCKRAIVAIDNLLKSEG